MVHQHQGQHGLGNGGGAYAHAGVVPPEGFHHGRLTGEVKTATNRLSSCSEAAEFAAFSSGLAVRIVRP